MSDFSQGALATAILTIAMLGLMTNHHLDLARSGPKGLERLKHIEEATPNIPSMMMEGAPIASVGMTYFWLMVVSLVIYDNDHGTSNSTFFLAFACICVVICLGLICQFRVHDVKYEEERRLEKDRLRP